MRKKGSHCSLPVLPVVRLLTMETRSGSSLNDAAEAVLELPVTGVQSTYTSS